MTKKQSPEEIRNYWNSYSPRGFVWSDLETELDYAIKLDPFQKRLIDSIEIKNKRVLDLGCGQGIWSYYMGKKNPDKVTGLDIAPDSIETAKRNFQNLNTEYPVEFELYDGLTIPFKDNSFDVIFSIGVIHHAADDSKVTEEAHRILAPGGLFVGCVYRKNSPGYFIRKAIAANQYLKKFVTPGTKNTFLAEILLCPLARHYSISGWEKLLENAGFKNNQVWSDFCGLERWVPPLGIFVDKLSFGKLGYYVLWKSSK